MNRRLRSLSVLSAIELFAFLIFAVACAGTPGRRRGRTAPTPPMNLVGSVPDPNGFPLNPTWKHHRDTGQLPDPVRLCGRNKLRAPTCTTQPTSLDTARQFLFVCKPVKGTFSGHLNRGVATYEGTLKWRGWEPSFLDSDYGFLLIREDIAGLTSGNEGGLKLEFSSRETVDDFETPWWAEFRSAVQRIGSPDAADMIDDKWAVVTGLLGLDCVHHCQTEVHPVFSFAARVREEPDRERWAVFLRSQGNEGFCSRKNHALPRPLDRFLIRLPWKEGMAAVEVVLGDTKFETDNNEVGPLKVEYTPDSGVFLNFSVGGASNGEFHINGDLRLRWILPQDRMIEGAGPPPAPTETPASAAAAPGVQPTPEPGRRTPTPGIEPPRRETEPMALSPEEWLERSTEDAAAEILKMPPEQRRLFLSRLSENLPRRARRRRFALEVLQAERVETRAAPRPRTIEPPTRRTDAEKERYDRLFDRTWKEVFGTRRPKETKQ